MAAVDYRSLAGQILEKVGGEANVASVAHCATRLRFKLKDNAKADKAAVEKLTGVITVVEAGGQFQVVIGNDVPVVYAEIGQLTKLAGDTAVVADEGPKGNLLNQFIDLISKVMSPILWPLAGAGLLKAFLALATQLNWLDPAGQTYAILNAAGDAIIYFLPIFLGYTAAKRFGANQVTAMALGAALVYPSIVALNDGSPVHFLGIPVAAPEIAEGDLELLASDRPDFIAFNYYATHTVARPGEDAGAAPGGDQQLAAGEKGVYAGAQNPYLPKTEFGWEIDPIGFRNTFRAIWDRYHLPLLVTENGLGAFDKLEADGSVHDGYRIDYLRDHIAEIQLAVSDGVEVLGYCPWSAIDLVSTHQGVAKRYGFIYVNRDEFDLLDLARHRKDSFGWYSKVIASNGADLA